MSSSTLSAPPPTPSVPARPMRQRTFGEQQKYLWAYGAGISCFSPTASLYQLLKLNPGAGATLSRSATLALPLRIFPVQVALKAAQMNAATPIKEHLSPWAAFGVVGVLQGGVYGQSNVYFATKLKIGARLSYAGMFRGVPFACGRDMISQGVPFEFSPTVRKHVFDRVWPDAPGDDAVSGAAARTKQWAAVLSTSVVATYLSQSAHNIQITMQAHHDLSWAGAVRKAFGEHGVRLLWRGGEARVGLLLVVNVLNELLLKPAWEPVPCDDNADD